MEKTMMDPVAGLLTADKDQLIEQIISSAIKKDYALAVYKLPQKDSVHIIIDFSFSPGKDPFELGKNKKGFIMSPFLHKKEENFFIKADLLVNINNFTLEYSDAAEPTAKAFIEEALDQEINETNPSIPYPQPFTTSPRDDHYIKITREAVGRIRKGEFKKVVLARKKTIPSSSLHPAHLFKSLCASQADSLISYVKVPGHAAWIGASPEILVSIDKYNTFHTIALAGTQRAGEKDEISKAVWTQKEIEEQALVSRYIISCFKKIRLREYEEDGPRTIRAGNLFHLRTDYRVKMDETSFPDLGNIMLGLLHPTSAVCGMPKEEALQFIMEAEDLDRKFYSGYLGPVNIKGESHLFVNLRCAEIGDDRVTLFSGAGITAESVPEKEHTETELKMQLMENLFSGRIAGK